jgi:hypothetical protein
MQIQKRTMNWLPRPSLHAEAEAARTKRKAYSQAALSQNAGFNSALISTANTSNTGEQINLTLRIAAQRIQEQASAKLAKAQDSLNVVA